LAPELNQPNLPDISTNPSFISSSLIQSDPIKSNHTIVQGNYTFYNPKPQQLSEERKTPNDKVYNKSSYNSFNNNKNYDTINKNSDSRNNYTKNRNYFDNNINNKISNRVENNEKIKTNQINNINKIPQKSLEIPNSNNQRMNNLSSNNKNHFFKDDNYKQSSFQQHDYKQICEPSKGDMINNSNFNPLSKFRTMNIKEVKEFVPKNFVIINKESKI